MVTRNPRGYPGHPPQGDISANANIMMLNSMIGISMQAKNYDIPKVNLSKDQLSTSRSNAPLKIEKPDLDPLPHLPKGEPHQTTYNPNARATRHYSIVKDLAREPCSMSSFKVLKSFPTQRKALLSSIGGVDPLELNIPTFDVDQSELCLSHQLVFQIQVWVLGKNVF